MTAADKVVEAFGSQIETARAVGVSYQRVHGWKRAGRIPSNMHERIMAAAKANRVKLKPADLVNC